MKRKHGHYRCRPHLERCLRHSHHRRWGNPHSHRGGEVQVKAELTSNPTLSATCTVTVYYSAQQIADKITSVAAPGAGDTVLALPEVPEGYTVKIESTSNSEVITAEGAIIAQETETSVELVFVVTRTIDEQTASTAAIVVDVPGLGGEPQPEEVPVEAVAVSPNSMQVLRKDETLELSAVITPATPATKA